MSSAVVYVATSKDGFIAKEDGAVDWLDEANATAPPGEDFGFGALMASVDAMVMGRKTFDKVLEIMDSGAAPWPYGETPVRVWTREKSRAQVPAALERTVAAITGEPGEVLATLTEELSREKVEVYVDGGETIRAFLAAGLIGRAVITAVPVTLGAGIPLFQSAAQRDALLGQVGEPKRFENGFVQTTLERRQESSTAAA